MMLKADFIHIKNQIWTTVEPSKLLYKKKKQSTAALLKPLTLAREVRSESCKTIVGLRSLNLESQSSPAFPFEKEWGVSLVSAYS